MREDGSGMRSLGCRGWKVTFHWRGSGFMCEGLQLRGAILGFRAEGYGFTVEGQGCMV